MIPGTYLLSFIKIKSVTGEIFLIVTNVTWTNVALTNITVIDVPSRNLQLNFHQNWVSNR